MVDALGERGFGLLLILLALPNCIPFPGVPGVSFVTGMAIFLHRGAADPGASMSRLCRLG